MNKIDIKKCDSVFTDITKWAKYDETNEITGAWNYEKFAREIEAELYHNYFLKNKIGLAEYRYIFGRVCIDALAVGGEDFFEV